MMEKKNYVLEMLVNRHDNLKQGAELTASKILETEQVQRELKERLFNEKEELRQLWAAINQLDNGL